MKVLLLFGALIYILLQSGMARGDCSGALKSIQSDFDQIFLQYKVIDPNLKKISEPKYPYVLDQHSSRVVYALHGFLGSPGEMEVLVAPFRKAGWTVVNSVIPGHGGSAKTANTYKKEYWRNWVSRHLNLLSSCSAEVHGIGFSTGGLLLVDYQLSAQSGKLKSLNLISPYFKSYSPLPELVGDVTRQVTDEVSVRSIYKISHHPDLKVIVSEPEVYLHHIPLLTADEIVELGESVLKKSASKDMTKVNLFLTRSDRTADVDNAMSFIESRFPNTSTRVYKNEPHHLMAPRVSNVAQDISEMIFSRAY